jgi:hypothetical protein
VKEKAGVPAQRSALSGLLHQQQRKGISLILRVALVRDLKIDK